jgi:amino acid adenylation domain-containing protein
MNSATNSTPLSPRAAHSNRDRPAIENMYPLSSMQEGLLFHTLLSPSAGAYVPQIVLSLSGTLKVESLKKAWEAVLARHSILRTGFYWEQRDQPFQVVYQHAALAWVEQDWRSLSVTEQSAKLQALLACNGSEPFNLHQPPLMRLILLDCGRHEGRDRYRLIWCYHHLILDGWSASQLLKEVFQQYFVSLSLGHTAQPAAKPASLQRPYSDYIAWLSQQDSAAAKSFWQHYLQGWNGPQPLPIINASPLKADIELSSQQRSEQQRPLSAKATQQIKAFVRSHKITLNTLVQAALGLVLSRYCDSADVVFGATCAGRPAELAGSLSMVGLFINTLPVRVQVDQQMTVADWLQTLSAERSATTDYEYVSLRELQTWCNQGQSLFDCLLVFENYPVSTEMFSAQADSQPNLQLEQIQFNEWTHLPLTVLVSESPAAGNGAEQLTFTAKYHSDHITSDAVSRLLGHLCTVMIALTQKTNCALKEISLLCSAEQQQLAAWNRTAVTDCPLGSTVPDLFEAQVEKTPRAIALTFETQSLTYQALNAKANQLAHHLQQLGIGPEQRVAIYCERSREMVIALLAIVKSGAAYVPLDPSYPAERLSYMLSDADVSAIVGQEQPAFSPSELPFIRISEASLSEDTAAGISLPTTNPLRHLSPENSIYVIYTSGSTGQPKGVINTHQALVNRLCWMQQTYGAVELSPEQKNRPRRILHKTPLSFDVSVWEIFWPLLNGDTLVVAKPNGHKDSEYLARLIETEQITTVHFVPSMLATFLEACEGADFKVLKQVICSGEALPYTLQEAFFRQFPTIQLHNLYGPTEAAIDVTAGQCQPGAMTVSIGRPIANTQIHLLDSHLNPVPVGIPGELYIGGMGLARGYHNRPDLTAEKFIPNPFSQPLSGRLYKSGDLARYLADGSIEYLGRRDGQIKRRGVRIELGEIEAALCTHTAIRQAVVVEGLDSALVAYIVGDVGDFADLTQALSVFLQDKLPEVMIPTVYMALESLPLSPNGKLDRLALPEPTFVKRAEPVAPRNETERAIADIWSAVLQVDGIGIGDNFFALGGHSLSATRVNTRLRKHFNLALPLQSAFEYPTLEALARHIDALRIGMNRSTTHSPIGHKAIEL